MRNGAGASVDHDCLIMAVEGDLDVSRVPGLRSTVQHRIDDGWTRFVVDLRPCTFIDSAGFGFLVGCRRRARQLGGGLEIVATEPDLLRVLALAELDRIFELHGSVEDAVARLVASTGDTS